MKKCGIYLIKCSVTEEAYVGMAENIEKRWRQHILLLRRGRHHSPMLQTVFGKFGETSLAFKILELCDMADLPHRELAWISKLRPTLNYKFGFPPISEIEPSILEGRINRAIIGKTKTAASKHGVPARCKHCREQITGKEVCECGAWLRNSCQDCHDEIAHARIKNYNIHSCGSTFAFLNSFDRDPDQ